MAPTNWKIRVQSIQTLQAAQSSYCSQLPQEKTCPGMGDIDLIPGTYLELLGLQPRGNCPGQRPSPQQLQLAAGWRIRHQVTPAAWWRPAALRRCCHHQGSLGPQNHPKTDSYLLEWSRADGTGSSHSLETARHGGFFDAGPRLRLQLQAPGGQLQRLQRSAGGLHGGSHSNTGICRLKWQLRPVSSFYLAVAISEQDQTRHCRTKTYCLAGCRQRQSAASQPAVPNFYQVRAYPVPEDGDLPR